MSSATPDQRRTRRHVETREQVLQHALDVIGEHGVGGLSLGEVARRLGVRTPSLYTYVDSKSALVDALFARGWRDLHTAVVEHLTRLGPPGPEHDLVERGVAVTEITVRWVLEHPALSQLMLFRPVPDWEPSADAYASSVAFFQLLQDEVDAWQALGALREDADPLALVQNIASASAGVMARQLANEPGVPFREGHASRHHHALIGSLLRSSLRQEFFRDHHPDPRH